MRNWIVAAGLLAAVWPGGASAQPGGGCPGGDAAGQSGGRAGCPVYPLSTAVGPYYAYPGFGRCLNRPFGCPCWSVYTPYYRYEGPDAPYRPYYYAGTHEYWYGTNGSPYSPTLPYRDLGTYYAR